jgi:integrase
MKRPKPVHIKRPWWRVVSRRQLRSHAPGREKSRDCEGGKGNIGTPLLRRNLLRAFKVALARAGLPQTVHFHDLRHAHATLLLRAGVPLKTASARLGHSGITITGDLYQHVASDLDVEAAERAAAALAR